MAGPGPAVTVTTVAFAALLLVSHRATASEEKCRTGCGGIQPSTFKYEPGTTYSYTYEGSIEVTLSTAEGQQTGTKVKANVHLTHLSDCNQVLKLDNVHIFGPDGKAVGGQIENIGKPIKLNFHDGHIEDVICVEHGDTQNSLNLKRAIASMFQANIKHNHETDVFGLCPTDISTRKDGQTVIVQKHRHLNKCAYRESIQQDFLATSFNLNSEIKSSPILSGDYSSQQKIKNGILEEADVSEDYVYVPFSVGKSGAKAQIHSKLRFSGSKKESPSEKCGEPRSIIFENPHPVVSSKANANAILGAVKAVAESIGDVVAQGTTKHFVDLIKIIREAKTDDLLNVYNQVGSGAGFKDKEVAKKAFMDALFRAGTGESIEVAIRLLKTNKLTDVEKAQVYLGLSFVKHATKNSLVEATKLLDQQDLPRLAYLGVGSLAGRYCREHPCKNVDEFNKLVQKLLKKLEDGKATNRKKENEIVYILKSLANIHHLSDNVLGKLEAIAKDNKQPTRVRVTALETFLADPCKDRLRNTALNILKDIQQDSEIRIKAYLVVAQCPNGKAANAIKALLETEPSYQVGGFIVSHIRNVRASANPDKELAKQQLGMIGLPKKFPFDFRKYSFNGEFSYAVDTLGIASSVETNVIYSQKSFLPRSTSLNLTTELFGHTFNFLEVATRQENLDRLLERYFGPKSTFFDEHHRIVTRDIKSEIKSIADKTQIKTNELNNDLDLDLSVKLFGSEFLFVNINEEARKYTPEYVIDKVAEGVNKGADEAKHMKRTFRSNAMFLDAELSYPTSLGFPLRLAVEGSSAVQVAVDTNFDVNPSAQARSDVKIGLVPSANIEIAGRMTLDAYLVENGLRVSSTLYTATGGDLRVEVFEDRKGFDVKFGLPVEEQKIISASHDVVFNTRYPGQAEEYHQLKFSQNKEFGICVDQLSSILGITFCGELSGPNLAGDHVPVLPFPLNGNSKYEAMIKREDIKTYHVRFDNNLGNNQNYGAEFAAEAIGIKGDKKFALKLEAYPLQYFKASLDSPIKKASAEARFINTDNEKALMARVQHDQNEYYGKAGVSISGGGDKSIYKPILEYRTPQDKGVKQSPYNVKGQIIHEANKGKLVFDNVQLVMPNQKAVTITGSVGTEKGAQPINAYVDLKISADQSATIKGRIIKQDNGMDKLNLEVQNTFNPEANFNLKVERKMQPFEVYYNVQLIHGQDLSSKTNIISLESKSKYQYKSKDDYEVSTDNKFSYPLMQIKAQVDFEAKPKSIKYDVEVQHRDVKIGSEMDLKHCQKAMYDYEFEFELYGLENRIEIEAKRDIITEGLKSKIHNSVEINGKKYELSGTVNHQVKPQNVNVGADVKVKIPGHQNPVEIKQGYVQNANEIDTHLKIASGSNVYIDTFLKAARGGNANGSVKVNIKDHLVINGQIKAAKGSGSGDVAVEFVKQAKKLKADTTFTIHPPGTAKNQQYTVVVNVHPDDKKKLTISTDTKASEGSFDSQNFVEYQGKKVAVNAKGTMQGQVNNGKVNGEVELALPNDFYAVGKFTREVAVVNDILNGFFTVSFEHRTNKNTPGCKVILKGTAKDTSTRFDVADIIYNLVVDDNQGKNLNADLTLKRTVQNDVKNADVQFRAQGSILPHPAQVTVHYGQGQGVGTYQFATVYGPETAIQVNGEYRVDPMVAYTGLFNVDAKTSCKVLKVFRFRADGTLGMPKTAQDFATGKGTVVLFAEGDGSNKDATIDFASEGSFTARKEEGSVKGMVRYQKQDPISLDVQYKHTDLKGIQSCFGSALLQYSGGKAVKGEITHTSPGKDDHTFDIKVTLPTEKVKNIDLKFHTKKPAEGNVVNNQMVVTADGQTYSIVNEIVLSESAPSFSAEVKYPDGKTDEFKARLNRVSERVFDAELKAVYHRSNFVFDGSVEANLDSVDDFTVKVKVDSPSMKLDKINFEASNKSGGKGGKRILVSAKSAGKNLLSGSTSYKAHQEGNKYIVEGSGTVKVKEESKSANFKYIRQNLSTEKNGEKGVEISFDAAIGSKAVDSELKITNKQFRLANSYCEEKKQCAHVEVDSKVSSDDVRNYNHELEVSIDLRKLGLTHEFGLKAVTNRKEFQFDHTVDVHFQNQDNSKYQYSVYVHPKKAGASLTTPKRIMAIEGVYSIDGEFKGEIVAHLDKKNQPQQKTSLTAYAGIDKSTDKFKVNGAFRSPAIGRPLTVSYVGTPYKDNEKGYGFEATVDIFPKEAQKLTINGKSTIIGEKDKQEYTVKSSVEVKSTGLKVDVKVGEVIFASRDKRTFKYKSGLRFNVGSQHYDTGVSATVAENQLDFQGRLFNRDIFRIYTTEMAIGKDLVKVRSVVEVYGGKPYASYLEIKNLNTLKYTFGHKDSKDQIAVNAGLIPGQIADFRAEVHEGSAKHDLVHASVKLDDANFMKSDYGISSENIKKYFLSRGKEETVHQLKEIRDLIPQLSKEFADQAKAVAESGDAEHLRSLQKYYVSEGQKIKQEFLEDKTIADMGNFLKSVIGATLQTLTEIYTSFNNFLENIAKTLHANFSKLNESFERELLPKLKETVQKIVDAGTQVFEKLSEVFFAYVARITQFLDEHQADFKEIISSINVMGQDVARFLLKSYQSVRELIGQQVQKLVDEIRAFPLFDELKMQVERLRKEGFVGSEALINTFRDAAATIKDAAPTPELKQLVASTADYIEKKLKRQPVDDFAEIQKIIDSINSIVRKALQNILSHDVKTPGLDHLPLFSLDYIYKLPKLVAVKFSPLAYLLSEGLQTPYSLLRSLSLNPHLYLIPAPHSALLVQGKHVFTFDGKHLTFPGKCDYLLARDASDGNFTLVGTYTDGFLTAITLADAHDAVTLKKGGSVSVNGASSELPVFRQEIEAYRLPGSITLRSRSGVEVVCGAQLVACGVHVSGYYHGRLRGLLGNGNNEPYDDFAAPDGKVAASETAFGNSYKMQGKCPEVKAAEHHHGAPSAECAALFGFESPLKMCYPFVDPVNFRTACEHGVAAGDKEVEMAVAVGYVATCTYRGIPVKVPQKFVKCENSEKPFSIGDTFSVKLPGKSADVMLLVDVSKANEAIYNDMFAPLVQKITQEMSSKGISDVEYHLITYGGANQHHYPHYVTVDGSVGFKGKAPKLQFSEPHKHIAEALDCNRITEHKYAKGHEKVTQVLGRICERLNAANVEFHAVLHDLSLAFGTNAQARTYAEALRYPFRSHATRTIIALTGNECEVGRFLPLQVIRSLFFIDKKVHVNLITPLKELKLKDAKQTKDVIGFNKYAVFTASQAKKKPDGNPQLLKQLEYEDYCSQFTVVNGGSVFIADNYAHDKDKFIQTIAHNIADQVANTEQGLDCECTYGNPYAGRNVCSVTYTKENARKG